MSKHLTTFTTHKQALQVYNELKAADDVTYKNPIYLAKAMQRKNIGEITRDGRIKFTSADVRNYLKALQRDKIRQAALEERGKPKYGVSPAFIRMRCSAYAHAKD